MEREEFEKLAAPLIEELRLHYSPHHKIIIDSDSAELVSGEMAIVNTNNN